MCVHVLVVEVALERFMCVRACTCSGGSTGEIHVCACMYL